MSKNILFSDHESDSDQAAPKDGLKINENFKEKYEFNQKRLDKERLTQKYGANASPEDLDEEFSSSSEDDDSEGKLLTKKGVKKYNDLLSKIIKKDKSIYQIEGEYFNDADFDD